MTKEEFDTLKIGDFISNEVNFGNSIAGYKYKVVYKDNTKIKVALQYQDHNGTEYVINRNNIESCLDLHKL